MEQENRSFIHDTINLDEIRKLLEEDYSVSSDIAVEESPVKEALDNTTEEAENELISDDAVSVQKRSEETVSDPESGMKRAPEPEMKPESAPEAADDDEIEIPSFVRMEESGPVVTEPSDLEIPAETEETETAVEPQNAEEEPAPIKKQFFFAKKKQEQPIEQPAGQKEGAQKSEKKKTSAAFETYSMLHDVIYLLAAVTLIFVFVVRLVGVQGDSMLPTLHNRDFLLLESNFLYGNDFRCGDVVVLSTPGYEMEGDHPIVKRIIATEGDEVNIDFETGAVYVNGVMLHESYIHTPTNYNWDGEYGLEYPAVVPENCIFVLGDNRNNSMDSRYAPIGMVDERCVLGKVLLIALPGQTVDSAGNVIDSRDWGRIGLVS